MLISKLNELLISVLFSLAQVGILFWSPGNERALYFLRRSKRRRLLLANVAKSHFPEPLNQYLASAPWIAAPLAELERKAFAREDPGAAGDNGCGGNGRVRTIK
jgi:hypothetical protein